MNSGQIIRNNVAIPLGPHWMPFTANRDFKAAPRMVERAKGVYFYTPDDRPILDMTAGLWCSNLGHGRPEIAKAVSDQILAMDFAPSFQFGHGASFELAERLTALAPDGLDHVFFAGSGSEAVETAIKMCMAYWHARGAPAKKRFIGREKGYHGVNLGGLSLGGLKANRLVFGDAVAVDHLRHTHFLDKNAFSRGLPEWGAEELLAEVQHLVDFHGAEAIAAIFVEPMAGAGGVILPPKGYLAGLQEICRKNDILLVFDEVITGFGRLGASFASNEFDLRPDMITFAKGVTSGTVPMGGVLCSGKIYDEIVTRAGAGGVEFFHGYTYSAHPVACAAALAALDLYEKEDLFTVASGDIGRAFEEVLHSFADLANVIDVRNYGLVGAVEFAATDRYPSGSIGYAALKAFWGRGVMVRGIGDSIAVSPPLVISPAELETFRAVGHEVAGVLAT